MHEIKTPIAIYRTGNVEIKLHIAFGTPCLLTHNNGDCLQYLLCDNRIAALQTPWANLKRARTLPFAWSASSSIFHWLHYIGNLNGLWILCSGWWNTLARRSCAQKNVDCIFVNLPWDVRIAVFLIPLAGIEIDSHIAFCMDCLFIQRCHWLHYISINDTK